MNFVGTRFATQFVLSFQFVFRAASGNPSMTTCVKTEGLDLSERQWSDFFDNGDNHHSVMSEPNIGWSVDRHNKTEDLPLRDENAFDSLDALEFSVDFHNFMSIVEAWQQRIQILRGKLSKVAICTLAQVMDVDKSLLGSDITLW